MKEMTLMEICRAVNGKLSVSSEKAENITITNISTDTRTVEMGDLFVPFKGDNFDAHDFLNLAFEKGAVCALSEKMIETDCILILVDDTRQAFCDLAQYYLTLFNVKVVGITGSVGKTTTKDMIASVLSQKYNVLKTEGNFNNDIGLPKTVFNLTDKHEVAVLEMGMNQFGEISRLSKVCKPDIAVITNVGVSHIENLGSREGILKAKTEIFHHMKKDGVAILNYDDDMLKTIEGKLDVKTLWFSLDEEKDFYGTNINARGIEGIDAALKFRQNEINVSISIPGEHMVLNALSAAAVGSVLKLSMEEIKKGIETFVPTAMRMAVIKGNNGTTIINDVYNANPVSMMAAIDVLASEMGKKVAIIGDMFELGDFAPKLHYDVGVHCAKKNIDLSICIGELSYNTYKGINENGGNGLYFKTKEEFFNADIEKLISKGDICLVKASRGMHFEEIVEKLQEVK